VTKPFRFIHVIATAAIVLAAGCRTASPSVPEKPAALRRFEFVELKMGAGFRVVLWAPDDATAQRAAEACFARVDQLNPVLSDYDPNSEIRRLGQRTNDGPMPEPVKVSDDLFNILRDSMRAAERSGGAFDVTVGPFIRLWRRSRDLGALPTPERIEKTRQSVGSHLVKLDPNAKTVQLLAPRMHLDVSGIAVGYVVDRCLDAMKAEGVDRALIDAAGDLAVGEAPPGEPGWRVAIQSVERPNETAGYVLLRHAAVSTSGDTYRYVELDGVRYSHILDPGTGLGLTSRTGATVIAPNCETADWMATACCVLGPQGALELAARTPGTAVRVTTRTDGGMKVSESPAFRPFLTGPASQLHPQP
jgi:FAD:protein FMN transferase